MHTTGEARALIPTVFTALEWARSDCGEGHKTVAPVTRTLRDMLSQRGRFTSSSDELSLLSTGNFTNTGHQIFGP